MPFRKMPTLRTYLFWPVLVAVLPLAVFAAIVATVLVDRTNDAIRAGVEERTQALLSAVDNELKSSIMTLRAITASPPWQRGQLTTLRAYFTALLASQPDWSTINLARSDRHSLSVAA